MDYSLLIENIQHHNLLLKQHPLVLYTQTLLHLTYLCKYCNLEFNTRQSKSRHELKFCKQKKEINNKVALLLLEEKLAQKDKVYITKVTDSLDINYRFDDCHFNKFGTEKIAIEISKIINKLNNKK